MNALSTNEEPDIFDHFERWEAFHEIETHIPELIKHWLIKGAEALRADFSLNPTPNWSIDKWGPWRDTRWYLTKLGPNSIGVGIGWTEFELHLFYGGRNSRTRDIALQILEESHFGPLRCLIGEREGRSNRINEGSILSDLAFNPYSDLATDLPRVRVIAWHAAHATFDFVDRVSRRIGQVTEDPAIVALIEELNRRADGAGS